MYKKYYQYEKIDGTLRVKKEKIPKKAFRESIANALIYRLWDVNSHIRISMFDDRIEIISPEGLPAELSNEEYLDGQISLLRNPIIGNVFFRLHYIEMFGTGIQRINSEYANMFVKPTYKIYDNSIKIILPVISENIFLTSDEEKVISILRTNLKLSRFQIEKETKFSKDKTILLIK